MTTYSPISIPKKTNGGRTKPKDAEIILGLIKDVETFPLPDAKGVLITAALAMKTGKTCFAIEVTASTIGLTQTTEGDPDNKGVKPKLEFSRPGSDDLVFEEFLENNINEDMFAIIRYPASGINKLLGSKGNPLQITAESTDTNEGDTHKITLETALRGARACFYEGTIPPIQGKAAAASGAEQSV